MRSLHEAVMSYDVQLRERIGSCTDSRKEEVAYIAEAVLRCRRNKMLQRLSTQKGGNIVTRRGARLKRKTQNVVNFKTICWCEL